MATIREAGTEKTLVLEADYTVGRSVRSGLCIPDRRVSSQHAVIRWTGVSWEVKDLGSRNGTFVDGLRLRHGEGIPLRMGATLAFGVVDNRWEVTDDSPPPTMIVPVEGGEPVRIEETLLAFPSGDDPQITIYRATDGNWFVEGESMPNPMPLRNHQTLEILGRTWRFSAPEHIWQTSLAEKVEWDLSTMRIRLAVSLDEEHVEITLLAGNETMQMGTRSRNYLLLTLARRRLEDAARKLPDAECGWMHHEELAHDPSMAGSQLNIDIFRIRKHFASVNVGGAARIIERRPRAKQLRIGTARIEVTRL